MKNIFIFDHFINCENFIFSLRTTTASKKKTPEHRKNVCVNPRIVKKYYDYLLLKLYIIYTHLLKLYINTLFSQIKIVIEVTKCFKNRSIIDAFNVYLIHLFIRKKSNLSISVLLDRK